MIRFDLRASFTQVDTALAALTPWVMGMAFLLTLLGYYQQVWQQRHDPPRMLEAMGFIALAVMFSASVTLWWPLLVNLLCFPAEELARQDSLFQVNRALNAFQSETARLIADPGAGNNGHGALSPVWNYTWNLNRITRAGVT
ncbi:MAG: hypothetical protein ACHQX0_07470, partial [Desulfobaccales bacterium]